MSSTAWRGLQSYFEDQGCHENNILELKQGHEYVHPLCRRLMSTKSLELCTENLGCETGTLDFTSSSSDDDEYVDHQETKPSGCLRKTPARAKEMGRNYPPPLTSIMGRHRIAVQARRENGRLLLRAVTAPPSHTYMHAERRDGRLTLRLVNSVPSSPFNSQHGRDFHDEGDGDDAEGVEESEEEELSEEEHEDVFVKVDQNAKNEINGGGEMGVEEMFQRPSRCKEGGHDQNQGLISWGTFCVASS